MYLGDRVKSVRALWGTEVGVEDTTGQLTAHQYRFNSFTHRLLWAESELEAALRTAFSKADVVLYIHWNGHQAVEYIIKKIQKLSASIRQNIYTDYIKTSILVDL